MLLKYSIWEDLAIFKKTRAPVRAFGISMDELSEFRREFLEEKNFAALYK